MVGTLVCLWRYPVKSMQGEELNAADIGDRGLLGDRAWALVAEDNKVASAKNPRKWPNLFDFRSGYVEPPRPGQPLPAVCIALPDGARVRSDQPDRDQVLSRALGRGVSLRSAAPEKPVLEEFWPDIEGLAHRDTVTDESMPPGTFFDLAVVHLMTTATLDQLRQLYPAGRFEVRRFRPNLVVAPADAAGFVEKAWVNRSLRIGSQVRLRVTGPCPRCVMTTLAQSDLPRDPGVLRTALQHNQGHVGVYARVLQGGLVRRGDPVQLED